VKQQFDAVVVGACNPSDQEFIAQLPAWKSVNLTGPFDTENCGMYLLDYAKKAMEYGRLSEWSDFEYVYYSEGDMVLHLREHEQIVKHLGIHPMLVPHRFDAFPSWNDLPEQLRSAVGEDKGLAARINRTNSELIRIPHLAEYSCFLQGRIKACSEFWWSCNDESNVFPHVVSAKIGDSLPFTLLTHAAGEFCEVRAKRRGHAVPASVETRGPSRAVLSLCLCLWIGQMSCR